MKSFPWQILLDWYEKNGKHDFPWRDYCGKWKVESGKGKTGNPKENTDTLNFELGTLCYRVWLAEILLQQTQADRVVAFYNNILGKYPTIQSLGMASYEEFFPYYQGLGYYSRARNLLKTAKTISEEYDGIFPTDKKILKKLPGIGEYTARAILAFGYNEPILAWDTNLETIFSRYYKGAKNIKLTEEEKEEIEGDFRDFITSSIDSSAYEFGESVSEDFLEKFQTVGAKASFGNLENGTGIRFQNGVEEVKTFGTFSHKSTEEIVMKKGDSCRMTRNKNIARNINNALMDWARLAEPKTPSLFNPENYIFIESEFYLTRGKNENIEKKISVSFPIPDAEIIVTLHQDHKIYYSLSEDSYTPFILVPSENRETRKYIQDYFRGTYGLELSVRPIHKKWLSEDGKPYIAVNAQIQAGNNNFYTWDKKGNKII